jgi:hypothetical protein
VAASCSATAAVVNIFQLPAMNFVRMVGTSFVWPDFPLDDWALPSIITVFRQAEMVPRRHRRT